jgi:Concanavalin A-like lectin/glucanases superfamily
MIPAIVSANGLPTFFYPLQTDMKNYATYTGISDTTASNVSIVTTKSYKPTIASGSLYNLSGATTSGYYLQLSNITIPTAGMTVCFWAYLTANINEWFFQFYASNTNRVLLYYYNGSFGDAGALSKVYTLNINTWYHIVYIYGGASGTAALYVNGGPNGNGTTADATSTGNNLIFTTVTNYIGSILYNGSYSNGFSGYMNNFYMFPRILSAVEINAIYNQ